MIPRNDHMPPLPGEQMDAVQSAAAAELIAGPRPMSHANITPMKWTIWVPR